MSEKRKPVFVFLLKNQGKKTNKVEVFEAVDFFQTGFVSKFVGEKKIESCYRIRVNGRWFPKGKKAFYWKSEIRDLIFKSIQF